MAFDKRCFNYFRGGFFFFKQLFFWFGKVGEREKGRKYMYPYVGDLFSKS